MITYKLIHKSNGAELEIIDNNGDVAIVLDIMPDDRSTIDETVYINVRRIDDSIPIAVVLP